VAEKVAFNLKHSEKAIGAVKPDPTLGLTAESVDSSSQLPVQVDHSSALDTYMGVTKTSSSLSELDKMNNLFK
jgi:hypothetical protein